MTVNEALRLLAGSVVLFSLLMGLYVSQNWFFLDRVRRAESHTIGLYQVVSGDVGISKNGFEVANFIFPGKSLSDALFFACPTLALVASLLELRLDLNFKVFHQGFCSLEVLTAKE